MPTIMNYRHLSFIAIFALVVSVLFSVTVCRAETENVSPETIQIPQNLATLQETFQDASSLDQGKLVILIQDLHSSVQVQENIAELIHYFVEDYELNLVAYEGNEGFVETDKVFSVTDPKLTNKVAKKLLEQLRLSGAEYAHVTTQKKFQLWGMEDTSIYEQNINRFRKAIYLKQDAGNFIRDLNSGLIKTLQSIASEEGKKLVKLILSYRTKQITLNEYYFELIKSAREKNIDITDLTNFFNLTQTKDENQKINHKQFKEELNKAEDRLTQAMLTETNALEIYQALERLTVLASMVSLSSTRDQWNQYQNNRELFKQEQFTRLIDDDYQSNSYVTSFQSTLDELVEAATQFYETAQVRDGIISQNVLKILEKEEKVILVSGGFHVEGITQILEEKGISYLVVTPLYSQHQALEQKNYMEKLLTV